MTKGIVMNYRGSHKTQYPKQMIIQIQGAEDKKAAEKFTGKKIHWKSRTGKEIIGTITQPHGNNGCVRVHMTEKGLPGQALGSEVDIK